MAWAPDYITSAQLKAYVRVLDDVDDDEIADVVTAASRAVDTHCRRQFGQVAVAEARVYTAVFDRHRNGYFALIDDLPTTVGFAVADEDGTAVSSDDYTLGPVNALLKGMVYTEIQLPSAGDYTLTGSWGWTAVPAAAKLASKLQGSRFLSRRDSPYGIAGSPDQGSEMRLTARVDPDVAVSLSKYRRKWWAR